MGWLRVILVFEKCLLRHSISFIAFTVCINLLLYLFTIAPINKARLGYVERRKSTTFRRHSRGRILYGVDPILKKSPLFF